jgi:hypothetical protein
MLSIAARWLSLFGVAAAFGCAAAPALASPALTADPSSLDFGSADIHPQNQNGPFTPVTLTNVSADSVNVTSVALAGSDAASFQTNNNCGFLDVGQSCQVQLRFQPTHLGAVTADLLVDDDTGTTDVPLTGTGIIGTLTASPNPLTFNAQPYYYGGQTQGVQLTVGADAGVQTESAAITGPGASAFYVAWGSNCFSQFYYPNNGCGFGIGFQAPAPGVYTAHLEVTSDGNPNPLVVPLTAVALNGPHLTLTPAQAAFGEVPVGRDAAIRVTALNDGDYPTQIGETVAVTGLPDVFFLTDNTCDGAVLAPDATCALTAHFRPAFAGPVNASMFLIAGDSPRPVQVVGLSGTGLGGPATPPANAVALTGRAVVGGKLACDATAPPSAIGWMRNGRVLPGARGASLVLRDADVGARFSCRATVSGVTLSSAPSAPVRPRDLAGEPGAFIDRAVCRSAVAPSTLRVGGRSVAIATGRPATPEAPVVLRSAVSLRVGIDARPGGSGRRVTLTPRELARLGDGAHRLQISAGGASATATLGLMRCGLALELRGGPGRPAAIAVSARAGVRALAVRLSGLRLRVARRHLGELVYVPAGLPARRLQLAGRRSTANGVTVTLHRRGLRVSGLPPEVGVVRFELRAGVLTGRAGAGRASATLRGDRRATTARALALWQR